MFLRKEKSHCHTNGGIFIPLSYRFPQIPNISMLAIALALLERYDKIIVMND